MYTTVTLDVQVSYQTFLDHGRSQSRISSLPKRISDFKHKKIVDLMWLFVTCQITRLLWIITILLCMVFLGWTRYFLVPTNSLLSDVCRVWLCHNICICELGRSIAHIIHLYYITYVTCNIAYDVHIKEYDVSDTWCIKFRCTLRKNDKNLYNSSLFNCLPRSMGSYLTYTATTTTIII